MSDHPGDFLQHWKTLPKQDSAIYRDHAKLAKEYIKAISRLKKIATCSEQEHNPFPGLSELRIRKKKSVKIIIIMSHGLAL